MLSPPVTRIRVKREGIRVIIVSWDMLSVNTSTITTTCITSQMYLQILGAREREKLGIIVVNSPILSQVGYWMSMQDCRVRPGSPYSPGTIGSYREKLDKSEEKKRKAEDHKSNDFFNLFKAQFAHLYSIKWRSNCGTEFMGSTMK